MSAFSEYVTQAARAAGYDLSGPRSGGKKALAEDSGMSPASVSRMLAGVCLPDPYALPKLATALSVPVEDLLRLVGLLPEAEKDTGGAVQTPAGESTQPTPDDDDEVMRTVRACLADFNFGMYGIDIDGPAPSWVGDLASAIAGAIGGAS